MRGSGFRGSWVLANPQLRVSWLEINGDWTTFGVVPRRGLDSGRKAIPKKRIHNFDTQYFRILFAKTSSHMQLIYPNALLNPTIWGMNSRRQDHNFAHLHGEVTLKTPYVSPIFSPLPLRSLNPTPPPFEAHPTTYHPNKHFKGL